MGLTTFSRHAPIVEELEYMLESNATLKAQVQVGIDAMIANGSAPQGFTLDGAYNFLDK